MPTRLETLIRHANDELITKGNLAAIPDFFAADYVAHAAGKTHKGHAFIKRWLKELRNAIPDLRVKKIEIIHQTKDGFAWQRTLTGTHKAELRKTPPSGKKVVWHELFVTRIQSGKIAEDWMASDLAAALMTELARR